ncbi:hypothetical protein JU64_24285, partial [Salmonella enterica subsp. enterica]|nr:hypothetical protein [Salmonella enterica]MIE67865.1 hypothetical protein [Salmonella enterica subsp. enterica serovar Oranienburg]
MKSGVKDTAGNTGRQGHADSMFSDFRKMSTLYIVVKKARLFFCNSYRADATMRILFIKAAERSESPWQQVFHRAGYNVDSFTDLLSGGRSLSVIPYCAVKIEMPPQDTRVIQILSRWRSKGVKTPVMILSHERLAARRVAVINAGAD